ncbi:hypothetical protein HKBW3S43_01285 [Candidatus Hakubella thermalkaliphila]|uniref:Uncharacterized protein n=1 Tax=Candidatus Hakubella thermalkaliphila TaxID=2754717 RepID=A0A6V8PUD2_9ACTN|nr:hypothetical protein HKBW3S33_01129 [Candidatus Hakubella thermalkaliphila]GFP35494.1 hypothetical protein HKBW3S43_01285 [Candidatus Hakubella thermalkaliphila]
MCHSFLGAWVASHRLTSLENNTIFMRRGVPRRMGDSFGICGGIMALLDPS